MRLLTILEYVSRADCSRTRYSCLFAQVLVRTECCDALKKLTGITSETILKDCADDIAYLQVIVPRTNLYDTLHYCSRLYPRRTSVYRITYKRRGAEQQPGKRNLVGSLWRKSRQTKRMKKERSLTRTKKNKIDATTTSRVRIRGKNPALTMYHPFTPALQRPAVMTIMSSRSSLLQNQAFAWIS